MAGLDSVLQAATPVTNTIDKVVDILPTQEDSGLTPERAADIVDAQDTVHAIGQARRHPLWYRLLASAIPGAAVGGLGLGAKAGAILAGDRAMVPTMAAGASAGAALGGGASVLSELFDRATESTRLRRANRTLNGVSTGVKRRLADPDVAGRAQAYQAARDYPMRLAELGALVGGLGGSAYGAHSTPAGAGDPRVKLFGVEGPTTHQIANASRYGLAGTLAAAAAGAVGGTWWKNRKRKELVHELSHRKVAMDYGKKLQDMFFRQHPPELWSTLKDGVKVMLVDGPAVRSLLLTEFIGGGHGLVYDFIPADEIWIEKSIPEHDRSYILIHELYERALMSQGWDYDTAHDEANRVEGKVRRMTLTDKTAAARQPDPDKPEDTWLATNAPPRTPTGGRPSRSSNKSLMTGIGNTIERYAGGHRVDRLDKVAQANQTSGIAISLGSVIAKVANQKTPNLRSRAETVVYNQDGVVAIKKDDFLQFPGGGIDDGEEPAFAAYREAIEEADRKLLHLQPFGVQEAVWPAGENIVEGYDGFRNYLFLAMDGGRCGTTHEDNEDFGIVSFTGAIDFLESLKDRKDLQWRRSMIDAELAAIKQAQTACQDMTAKKLAGCQEGELAGSPSQETVGPCCAIMPHEEQDRTDNSPAILVDLDGTIRSWPDYESYSKLNCHQIMPGRKETLGPIRGMGFRIIGVTNHSCHEDEGHKGMTPERLAQIQHETIGLMDGILDDIVYTPHPDPDILKPAPTMLHFAIKRHGLDPARVMMVGDNEDHDGGAAKAAGVPFMTADDFFRDPEITVAQIKQLVGETLQPETKTADAINLLPRSEYILLNQNGQVLAAPDQGRRYRFLNLDDPTQYGLKTRRAPYQGPLRFVPQAGVAEPGAHGYEYNFHTGEVTNPETPYATDGLAWQDPHKVLKDLYGSMGRKENAQYRELDRARASVLLRALKAHKKKQPPANPGMTASPGFVQPG